MVNLVKKFITNLRSYIFPVKKKELKFFLPMAFLMFCALYNFASLRAIKDSLIVPNIGAESISFMKLWLVLPFALVFTIIYLKLSNIYKLEKLFYIIVLFFITFFLLFAFVIYPYRELLHPDMNFCLDLISRYPHFKWFIMIYTKWSYALIYIFSELWSVIVINLMFWQFANNVVSHDQAKRFYPLFGVIGNLGLVLAGNSLVYFSNVQFLPEFMLNAMSFTDSLIEEITLKLSLGAVVISGIIIMLIMRYINKNIYTESNSALRIEADVTKLSVKDSIRLIFSSKYIGYITIIIICYGLAINILEGPWKAKLSIKYPNQNEYLAFMGRFNIWMGISCVTFMIIGSNILRVFSWLYSALFTPIVLGITGIAFFIFVVWEDFFIGLSGTIMVDPVYAAIIAGGMQNILSKSSKYSLFDATKEMAYRPLSLELRTKGKAAAEVMGSKVGKSLGAVMQSALFSLIPSATFYDITPILMFIFIIVLFIWISDVILLSKEYNKVISKKEI